MGLRQPVWFCLCRSARGIRTGGRSSSLNQGGRNLGAMTKHGVVNYTFKVAPYNDLGHGWAGAGH